MSAAEILSNLERLGVRLSVSDDRIHATAPVEMSADYLRATLTEHKAELVHLLRTRQCAGCGNRVRHSVELCGRCRARALGWRIEPPAPLEPQLQEYLK